MVSYPSNTENIQNIRLRLVRAIAPLAGSTEYELLEDCAGNSAMWIKSLAQPETAFQVVEADGGIPGFSYSPDEAVCRSIGLSDAAAARVLLLVEPAPTGMRVNFGCPLIFNPASGLAAQVQASTSSQWQPPAVHEPASPRSRLRWQPSLAFMA